MAETKTAVSKIGFLSPYKPGQGLTVRWTFLIGALVLDLWAAYDAYWLLLKSGLALFAPTVYEVKEVRSQDIRLPDGKRLETGDQLLESEYRELLARFPTGWSADRRISDQMEELDVGITKLSLQVPALIVAMVAFLILAAFTYWLFNRPRIAEYLIESESEARKINWPGQREWINSSIAVLFIIGVMTAFLFFADQLLWVVTRNLRIGI